MAGCLLLTGFVLAAHSAWAPLTPVTALAGQEEEEVLEEEVEVEALDPVGEAHLWVMDADGGNLQNLGDFPPIDAGVGPAWSPDGTTLAFESGGAITLLDVATGTRRELHIKSEGIVYAWQPAWSPDGTRLLVNVGQADAESLDLDLAVIDVASGELSVLPVLTEGPMLEWPGAWSPDGEWIAFTGAREEDTSFEIFVVPAAGGEPVRLTDDPGHELSPTWSPDGERLAFVFSTDFGMPGEIVTIDADGSTWEQVTAQETGATSVAWSPAGDRLAFTVASGDASEIHTIAIDDSDERNVTNHPAIDVAPAWSPDGKRIAFVSDRDDVAAPTGQADGAATPNPLADLPPCAERLEVDEATRTQVLVGDCIANEPVTLAASWTFDGQGHTIWAVDPPDRDRLAGAVLIADGGVVTVRNVTIDGSRLIQGCDGSTELAGVLLEQAGGDIDDVQLPRLSRGTGRSCASGLVIRGPEAPPVTVSDLTIDDPGYVGILVTDAVARISASTVTGGTAAVRAEAGATVDVVENTVELVGSSMEAENVGLFLTGNGTQGTISGNSITGTGTAIEVADGATASIVDNTVTSAEMGSGIGLRDGAIASVVGNQVSGASLAIYVAGGARGEIQANVIIRPTFAGIEVWQAGTHATITGNTIEDAQEYGVHITRGATAEISDNTLHAQIVGVLIEDGAARVTGNTVVTEADGIFVVIDDATAEVVGNTVTSTGVTTA